MILSFHPCFIADENRLCAGREPDTEDLAAIRRADAVILSQGASPRLYQMAAANCRRVFPDYRARFAYPGKSGQIRLFRETQTPHPRTWIYSGLAGYCGAAHGPALPEGLFYPCVWKFDWGGEGENVRFLKGPRDLENALAAAAIYERSGQSGFLLQRFIPAGGCSLRVVVMAEKMLSYWKKQADPRCLCAGIASGAEVDRHSAPELRETGCQQARRFCRKSGIDLAGLDLLFPHSPDRADPLLLEINYFFGRKGLGGSLAYYQLLEYAIIDWIDRNGLPRPAAWKEADHEQV
ncbi:MAG TPA: hypothetical protein VKO20_05270 [Desulfosalsimonadaceae bacterium]|nr:hypothetical protein [Desulfosalsimonadaceae bacterium]